MTMITIGQRYISSAEPELGLGIIIEVDAKLITILFPASSETRKFSKASSPLIRAQFDSGDEIKNLEGKRLIIDQCKEENNLFTYTCNGLIIQESQIHPSTQYNKPEENLFLGKIENTSRYQLRIQALQLKNQIESNPYRGLIGPKINLIPHQFYVANEVVKQPLPRVLLADEVGLGKTIEAGLILHYLLVNHRCKRALVIVPFALINQWFIELRRHFHLNATIINRLEDFEGGHNAFHDSSLIITSLEFITKEQVSIAAMEQIDFDMIIIDEAHRIQWSVEQSSKEYDVVSELAKKAPGLLLLSATPEKFGHEGHFARLKLIDPDRFHDYQEYIDQYNQFEEIAKNTQNLNLEEIKRINDEQGTGRIFFRNTRENIDKEHTIFPKRDVIPYPLKGNEDKISWLIQFLKDKKEKILVICRSKEAIFEIDEVLCDFNEINYLLFYSELTLVDRDKNAAQFAEDNGPNILICTEVGSEGRNFQFCNHIVFYDIPMDPDIVEQRIGRIDRIGQKKTVNIHIPYLTNEFEEVLFEWYHNGLDAFRTYLQASSFMYSSFEQYIKEARKNPKAYLENDKETLKELVAKTQEVYQEVKTLLNSGRNKLISMNSFHKEDALKITQEIDELDHNENIQSFLNHSFEEFGINHEETKKDQFFISPTETMALSHFPMLGAEGLNITFHREIASRIEKIDFMSIDHPMVNDLIELISSQGIGNITVSKWTGSRTALALECFFTAQLTTKHFYQPARYMPTQTIRVLVTFDGKNVTEKMSYDVLNQESTMIDTKDAQKVKSIPKANFKQVLAFAKKEAIRAFASQQTSYKEQATKILTSEYERLLSLSKKNKNIRKSELKFCENKKLEIIEGFQNINLRLDSLRLVIPK